ncbi:hypothetical protein YWS52_14160 [Chitiniphilus shinanonensis]
MAPRGEAITQIRPHPVERDQHGLWTHPLYPEFEEDITTEALAQILADAGVHRIHVFAMDCDVEQEHPAMQAYLAGDIDCTTWEPTTPAGDGWFLLSIHDTEDGPVAVFGNNHA